MVERVEDEFVSQEAESVVAFVFRSETLHPGERPGDRRHSSRRTEFAELRRRLDANRLLTVAGSGGVRPASRTGSDWLASAA